MKIRVRVTPNAKRDEILGWKDVALRVKVKAPPVEGKANAAVVELLATTLRVPRSAIRITAGLTDRNKTIEITADEGVIKKLLPGNQSAMPLM